jgi:hypothetical protein
LNPPESPVIGWLIAWMRLRRETVEHCQWSNIISPFSENFDFEGRSVCGFKQRQKLPRTHYGHLFLSFETGP